MTSRNLLSTIKVFIFATIIGTPLFYFAQGVYPYALAKMAFFQGAVEIVVFLYLALLCVEPRYHPKKTPALIALCAFFGILALTAITGADPIRSFWSTQERSLGIIALLHFVGFGIVLSALYKDINWKSIFYASLGTSLLADALAALQFIYPNLLLNENAGGRTGGTFGNPTFLAGYVVVHIFIAIYFLLCLAQDKQPSRIKIKTFEKIFLWFALAASFLTLLFITQTRGDVLGLAAGLFAMLIYFAFRPPELASHMLFSRRSLYAGFLIALVVASGGFWFTRNASVWKKIPVLNRLAQVSFSSGDLQPRIIAINAAWEGFKERPILGWGWDNFNIVFNKHYAPRALESSYQETRFDKPHNALLEYMVVAGVPGALAFLGFFIMLIYEGLKTRDRALASVVLGASVAYFVQDLFVFETIGPLLALFLLWGYADGAYQAHKEPEHHPLKQRKQTPLGAPWAWACIVVLFIPLYFINFTTIEASHYQYQGFSYFLSTKTADKAIASFKTAVNTPNPYTWGLKRDYATAVAEAYLNNPGLIPPAEAELAVKAMEEVRDEHPQDAYNHYALIDLYNQISAINPGVYLPKAEAEAKIALELSPNRQEVYFSLSKTKTLEKDYNGALALLKTALDLDPKVADAHFYYGLIAFAGADTATSTAEAGMLFESGYDNLQAAVTLGRGWKNEYEPKVEANFFADGGNFYAERRDSVNANKFYDQAIALYQKSFDIGGQKNMDTETKLGVAYFSKGDHENARRILSLVLASTDLSQSPAYSELLPIFRALGLK